MMFKDLINTLVTIKNFSARKQKLEKPKVCFGKVILKIFIKANFQSFFDFSNLLFFDFCLFGPTCSKKFCLSCANAPVLLMDGQETRILNRVQFFGQEILI